MHVTRSSGLMPAWFVSSLRRRELVATVMVKGTYRFNPGGPAEPLAEMLPPTGDVESEIIPGLLQYPSDFAPMKLAADICLTGSAHAPNGIPVGVLRATMRIGPINKSVIVLGDRIWRRGLVGASVAEPTPFTSMPLDYSYAFGGASVARNPVGRGRREDRLPNIEDPRQLMSEPGMTPEPTGFGPIPSTWPQRQYHLGTYGDAYMRDRWPWMPEDIDLHLFNAAPGDQQLKTFLRGDEVVELENLVAGHPRCSLPLPGMAPQAFARFAGPPTSALKEIPFNLDTLWINTDQQLMVLVWRGLLPVTSLKMEDVSELHFIERPLSAPAWTPSTYEAHLGEARLAAEAKRTREADEEAAAEAADQAELKATVAEADQLSAQAAGMAGARSPEAQAILSGPPNTLKENRRQLEALLAANPALLDGVTFLPGMTRSELIDLLAEPPPSPPWTRELCIAHIEASGSFSGEDLSGLDLSRLDISGLDFSDSLLIAANLTGVQGKGVILRGANLSGANCREAAFDGADLSQVDATGANFTSAKLDNAMVDRAGFEGANLTGASLVKITGKGLNFNRAVLDGAIVEDANLPQLDMVGAHLHGAKFTRAVLTQVRMEGSTADDSDFSGSDLSQAQAGEGFSSPRGRFMKCLAPKSTWTNADLASADFRFALLEDSDFTAAMLQDARLDAIDARKARFDDAVLTGASFTMANMFRGSFERSILDGADLSRANLYEVEFWDARVRTARLTDANLKGTKLG